MPTPAALAKPVIELPNVTVHAADALRVLAGLPSESIDAVVCDPPYAIRTVGLKLPQQRPRATTQPNGIAVVDPAARAAEVEAFADATMLGQQSANWHEKATHSRGYADNDNTVFARWVLLWARECHRVLKPGGHLVAFGGTRTWHRLATAIEDAGFEIRDSLAWLYSTGCPKSLNVGRAVAKGHVSAAAVTDRQPISMASRTGSATPTPTQPDWDGWYTGLKPAHEPIVLARKAPAGTIAANVRAHGTGALNIAATKLPNGRWPTNAFLDHAQADAFSGDDSDQLATRYFFVAKPSRDERVSVDGVAHPTVKPLALMRELIKLVTPPGATVLDPFAGSGSTLEAALIEDRIVIAIEKDPAYIPLIRARLTRQSASLSPSTNETPPTLEAADQATCSDATAVTNSPCVNNAWTLFDLD